MRTVYVHVQTAILVTWAPVVAWMVVCWSAHQGVGSGRVGGGGVRSLHMEVRTPKGGGRAGGTFLTEGGNDPISSIPRSGPCPGNTLHSSTYRGQDKQTPGAFLHPVAARLPPKQMGHPKGRQASIHGAKPLATSLCTGVRLPHLLEHGARRCVVGIGAEGGVQ